MDDKTREALEKQLQLLSERSQNAVDGHELATITEAMISITNRIFPAFLSLVQTCDLVNELKRREGVKYRTVEPYKDWELEIDGPAQVLVVID